MVQWPAAGGAVLRALSAATLSDDAAARFAELFAFKERWSLAQLQPYIESLVTPSATQSKLLMKHTRSQTKPDGTRFFMSRK